jgi:archaellum component FlaC
MERSEEERQLQMAIERSKQETPILVTESMVLGEVSDEPTAPKTSMKVGTTLPTVNVTITQEHKTAWKKDLSSGPKAVDCRGLSYHELLKLLEDPCLRVFLSKEQIIELLERRSVTGWIIIVREGFLEFLLHKIRKLKWLVHRDRCKIKELEREKKRYEVEVARLQNQVEEQARLIELLEAQEAELRCNNQEIIRIVNEMTEMVESQRREINALVTKIEELTQEKNHWKHRYEEEKRRADKYERYWHRWEELVKCLRETYDYRRQGVTEVLNRPLPCGKAN